MNASPDDIKAFLDEGGTLYILDTKPDKTSLVLICGKHRSRLIIDGTKPDDSLTLLRGNFPQGFCGCGPGGITFNFWDIKTATEMREFAQMLPFPNANFVTSLFDHAAAAAAGWECPSGCELGMTLTLDLATQRAIIALTHDDSCPKPDPARPDGSDVWKTGKFVTATGISNEPRPVH